MKPKRVIHILAQLLLFFATLFPFCLAAQHPSQADDDWLDPVVGLKSRLTSDNGVALGPIDIDLGNLIKYSMSKGWYFGFGATTNDRFSTHLRLSGFGGYWTRMKGFDYGGGVKWLIDREKQVELGVSYAQRSEALGGYGDMQESESLLSEDNYRYTFYENVGVRGKRLTLAFGTSIAKHFKVTLNLSGAEKRYLLPPFDTLRDTRFATAEVKMRFALMDVVMIQPNGSLTLGTLYPIVVLSYTHSFPNLFGSPYAFDRFKMEATQSIYTERCGTGRIMLQAGLASAGSPVMETFSILGSYQPFALYSPGSFGTMREHEFFCDRFVALFLSHNFSGTLWRPDSPWFRPELILATHLGWGDMCRHPEFSMLDFNTMEKGFFESGVLVNGLFATPFTQVGAGVFYRYGPYAFDRVWNNFALKWCATFSF